MEHSDSDAPGLVRLRDVVDADLETLFEHQRDPVAFRMAAFVARNRDAFMEHWRQNILGDDAVVKKAILCDDEVVGNVVCYQRSGEWLIGYWLGRPFWGQGIATRAMGLFVAEVAVRPIHALVAKDNAGSIRVLEKCGFVVTGEDRSPGLDGDVEEFVFTLQS